MKYPQLKDKLLIALLIIFILSPVNTFSQTISTVVAGIGDGLSAVTYGRLLYSGPVTIDGANNVYAVTGGPGPYSGRIRKINPAGIVTTFAGGGSTTTFGGLATYAGISASGIAIDAAGNFYISNGYAINKINTAGIITLVAGSPTTSGFSGDGGPATIALLNRPSGVAVDAAGNVYVADGGNNRIRKISPSGTITTIAGGGSTLGDGGPAISARIYNPWSVSVDVSGNVYIADHDNYRVRKVTPGGIISTIAGTGSTGTYTDGSPATASFIGGPIDIKADGIGNIYFSNDTRVFQINTSGIIHIVAGNGTYGYSGDGGPATAAAISIPYGIVFDPSGNMYISAGGRIREVNTAGVISTIAGNGLPLSGAFIGDGGPALLGAFGYIQGIDADRFGNLFMPDYVGYRIRKVDASGTLTTFAGNGIVGYAGDGGPATAAELDFPTGAVADRYGNVYIADNGTNHVRKVDIYGNISTIAGGGLGGLGDGGPATAAVITAAQVGVDSIGNVYIADGGHNRIRKVDASTGIITTVVTAVTNPTDVKFDRKGNMYIAGGGHLTKVDTAGIITTIPGVAADMITIDKMGNVYTFYNSNPSIVKRVDIYGYVSVIAGNGAIGYVGEGLPATAAELYHVTGVAMDTSGNLLIADDGFTVRKVCCIPTNIDHPPVYTNGAVQGMNICMSTSPTNIDTLLRISDGDLGQPELWTIATLPTRGYLSGFPYSTASTGGIVMPSGLIYTPTLGFSGTDNFRIMVSDGVDTASTLITVTVIPPPVANISGGSTLCTGDSISLTGTPWGGIWGSSNSDATVDAFGLAHGISAGVDTIMYTVTNSCGSAVARHVVTVNTTPPPGTISGPSYVCVGSSITLSDASPGGTWTCTGPYASIGSTSGILIGFAPGSTLVTYSVSNTCGTATATKSVSINPTPWAGVITGSTPICTGGTMTLIDTVTGGTWSSGNPLIATVSSTGIVTGIAAGSAVISYTVTSGCGLATAITIVNIASASPINPITGPSSVCTGSAISLHDLTPGGTWSSGSPSIATVSSTGVVTGIAAGVVAISYTASLGCGVSVATANITVNASVTAGIISGSLTLCAGATTLFSSFVSGGVWSSSNSRASVSPTGIVTGVSPGTDTIIYTVTNSCGTASTTHIINIYPAPFAGSISGPASVCTGSSIILVDTASGGIWSSTNPAIASVTGTGTVSGVSGGIVTISYTATTGCGVVAATKNIFVIAPYAGIITGVTTLCAGGTTTLTDAVSGGTWSSSNPSVANIGSAGLVTAIAGGATIISYTVVSSCGTATATAIFTVGSLPIVSPIVGSSSICAGASTLLTDATLSGAWSSSNPSVATVGSTGLVTGIGAGTSVISYIVTAGCGSTGVTFTMHVYAPPVAGSISGSVSLCVGGITALTDTVPGGAWSSSNVAVAAVGSSGVVSGNAVGSAVISYTVSNICGSATTSVLCIVGTSPSVSPITGTNVICTGASTTLIDTTTGGTWSSSNTSVATIGSTGTVTGISAGSAGISYIVTNACGSATATFTIKIDTLLFPGFISGSLSVCKHTTAMLTESVTGGVWSISDPSIATISNSGTVLGLDTGLVTISYTVTNSCGPVTATAVETIYSIIYPGIITGLTDLCQGATSLLMANVPGGTWTSLTPAIATVDNTGFLTGISPGIAAISYSITNTCGTGSSFASITVDELPFIDGITGTTSFPVGTSTVLSDIINGGAWSSSDTNIAFVYHDGIVVGRSAGNAIIKYSLTNSFGCSIDTSALVTVTPGDDDNQNWFKIFPNPTRGDLTIKWHDQLIGSAEILITDVVGRRIYRGFIEIPTVSGQEPFSIPGLITGVYMITIKSAAVYHTEKILFLD